MSAFDFATAQRVASSRWTSEQWAAFEARATPEQIAARLKQERGIAAAAQTRITRLEVLFARRCRQVLDGEWAAPEATSAPPGLAASPAGDESSGDARSRTGRLRATEGTS